METDYVIFNRNWPVYRKLVANNYMFHDRLGRITAKWLRISAAETAIRVLDLGCGDAEEIAKPLKSVSVEHYHGIDLSPMALEIAARNLEGIPGVVLTKGAMERMIEVSGSGFHVVHSSYAIHHLDDRLKASLLKSISGVLQSGGLFIITDIFRQPGQNREDYIIRYQQRMTGHWTLVTPEEREAIMEHITSSDFPAHTDSFRQWLATSGFEVMEEDLEDEHHHLMVLRKAY